MRAFIVILCLLITKPALAYDQVLADTVDFCTHQNGGAPTEKKFPAFKRCVQIAYPEIIKFYQSYYNHLGDVMNSSKETRTIKQEKNHERKQKLPNAR